MDKDELNNQLEHNRTRHQGSTAVIFRPVPRLTPLWQICAYPLALQIHRLPLADVYHE